MVAVTLPACPTVQNAYPYGKFLYATSFAYFLIERKVKALAFLGFKDKKGQDYIRKIFSGEILMQHEKILREFLAFIQAHHMRVIVVLFPDLRQIHHPDYPYFEMHHFVAQTVKRAGAEFLDLSGPLKKSGITNFTVSEFDSHPNKEVHRIAGAELFEIIRRKNLLARVSSFTTTQSAFRMSVQEYD